MRTLTLALCAVLTLQLCVFPAESTREISRSILDGPLASSGCTTYTIKAGDTCYKISQAYGISLATFRSLNPGIVCNDLQIGAQVCVSSASNGGGSTTGNGKIFREYIGAEWTGVKFTDVPINGGVEFHFILSFAIDYTNGNSPTPNNGIFSTFWDSNLSPSSVNGIKAAHKNVKVMVSLGGDTVGGNQNAFFKPSSVDSWVNNAVSSLTSLARQYNLDGIDIDYEHFSSTPEVFASCIGQLITKLKQNKVISAVSIAPFDGVQSYYTALWNGYRNVIDYVNFQFYTYRPDTTVAQFVGYYNKAASTYAGGKIMASFSTDAGSFSSDSGGITPSNGFLTACNQLKASGKLGGIFVWSADDSFTSTRKFQYESQAQALLAAA